MKNDNNSVQLDQPWRPFTEEDRTCFPGDEEHEEDRIAEREFGTLILGRSCYNGVWWHVGLYVFESDKLPVVGQAATEIDHLTWAFTNRESAVLFARLLGAATPEAVALLVASRFGESAVEEAL